MKRFFPALLSAVCLFSWLKRIFNKSAPKSQRIIYCLPNTGFEKYYYKGVLFKDVNWSEWKDVIDGFQKRFEGWYFGNMAGGDSSYLDLCSLCALVEVFEYYSSEYSWHEPGNYKEFLRKLNPIFRRLLSVPLQVTRLEGRKWTTGQLKDFADVFYAGVRCSLHHHGDLASYAGMKGTGEIAKESTGEGTSACGAYKYKSVIFDPDTLKGALEDWLKDYCDKLRGNPKSKEAARFRKKFENDFGICIP